MNKNRVSGRKNIYGLNIEFFANSEKTSVERKFLDDGRISEISGSGSSKNVKWRYSCGYRSRSTAGSGLVLSIAQAIAILHGGKIEVRNATNERGDARVCFAVEIYGV